MTRKATLPKLTRRELASSHARFGFEDRSIPADALKTLATLGVTDQQTLARIGSALSEYRAARDYAAARLSLKEREQQARDTAAVILDLIGRMGSLDPEVAARMTEIRFLENGDSSRELWDALALPALAEIHRLLLRAAMAIATAGPGKRGRKPEPLADRAFTVVEEAVQKAANLGKTEARRNARDILSTCGIELPVHERSLRRRSIGQN
jgi:hypothetical protein